MKKIFIPILALLFIPMMAGAVDELTLNTGHQIEVNGMTFIVTGLVDDMVIDTTTATFTLSANSSVTIRSNDRYTLPVSLSGSDLSCGTIYSQKTITGSQGSSLVFTPNGTVCSGTSGSSSTSPAPAGGGVPATPTPTTPTTPTTSTGEVTATADGGGETTLTTDESTTASVSLPIGAVTASTNIIIATESQETVTTSRPAPSSRSVVGGYIYNFTATAGTEAVSSFGETLSLTFTYTDAQIAGLNESNLRVFYWKELTSQWVALPTTIDSATNTLVAETDHFTYFAIMGLPEGETGEEEEIIEEETTTIVDGDLIRNPNAEGMAQFDIYIVKFVGDKKFKRLILSPHVFESYEHFDKNGNGSPWDDVIDVAQSVMDEQTTSDLVRAVGDSKVYRLTASGDTGTKRWMNMTANRFASQGNDSDSIYEINATDRNAYTAGADITAE